MAQQDGDEVEQDLSHIHWSFPEAIAANPAGSLATPDLAYVSQDVGVDLGDELTASSMDYFAYSPFWDNKSNNNVLRTQRRVENPAYGHALEKIELNAFTSGFEYVIGHSSPPNMFIVHRREVQSDGSRNNVTAMYSIIDGKIYPTPTLYDIVSIRLRNASLLLGKTFAALSAAHPPSNPRATSVWRSVPRPTPTASTEASSSRLTRTNAAAPRPDPYLVPALQSTRDALADLDRLASSPAPAPDPTEELKRIEAEVWGEQTLSEPGSTVDAQTVIGEGTHGASPAPSRLGIRSPMSGPGRLGPGSNLGIPASSPLASSWAPTPR